MSAVSEKLDRIEDAVDRIKVKVGATATTTIEDVATAVENMDSGDLSEYFTETISAGSYSKGGWLNSIKKLPAFENTGTDCSYMFYNYPFPTIDLSKFDTSNVTNMSYMFYFTQLSSLDLSNFDTSKVTDMSYMFASETNNITTISKLDASSVVNIQAVFSSGYISNISNFGGFENLGKAYTVQMDNWGSYTLNLQMCNKLTHDSLMNVINNLYDLNLTYDVAGGGTLYTQTLYLGSTIKKKLTASEIAIAQNKGWTVS